MNAIGPFVLFVRVTVWAALVLPIWIVPKSSVVPGAGAIVIVGISVNFAMNAAEASPAGKLVWNAVEGKTGKVADEENVGPVI